MADGDISMIIYDRNRTTSDKQPESHDVFMFILSTVYMTFFYAQNAFQCYECERRCHTSSLALMVVLYIENLLSTSLDSVL